jgi:molybdopterin/thiamine biosynthesis adenylyltransferase
MTKVEPFDPNEYYSRQIVLSELKQEGQSKLRRSKVAIIGLGGLGSVSAMYLARAGVGYLRLVDQDTVELKNLHRQILYDIDDLRYPKAEAAAKQIERINPEIRTEIISENLRSSNAEKIVKDMDCVIDGLDNMRTRYILNRGCVRARVPYIFGGAIGLEGNLSVFAPPETPCLECVLPNLDDAELPNCETRGVLGATPGVIGSMQAIEAVKVLAGIETPLKGRLLTCDFREMQFTSVQIVTRSDCPVCQLEKEEPYETKERLTWLCGRNTVNVNPPKERTIDLDQIYQGLRGEFKIHLKSPLVVVFEDHQGREISLFRQGRMLIKNVEDEKTAMQIYRNLMKKAMTRITG